MRRKMSTSDDALDAGLERLVRAIRATGADDSVLRLGAILSELESWLSDEQQWRRGRQIHWRSLIDDLLECLRELQALSGGAGQKRLKELLKDLKRLRTSVGVEKPDEAARADHHVARAIRAVANATLLQEGLHRVLDWSARRAVEAEDGLRAMRDVATLCGHDSDDLFSRIADILADDNRQIAQPAAPSGWISHQGSRASRRRAGWHLRLTWWAGSQRPRKVWFGCSFRTRSWGNRGS